MSNYYLTATITTTTKTITTTAFELLPHVLITKNKKIQLIEALKNVSGKVALNDNAYKVVFVVFIIKFLVDYFLLLSVAVVVIVV